MDKIFMHLLLFSVYLLLTVSTLHSCRLAFISPAYEDLKGRPLLQGSHLGPFQQQMAGTLVATGQNSLLAKMNCQVLVAVCYFHWLREKCGQIAGTS